MRRGKAGKIMMVQYDVDISAIYGRYISWFINLWYIYIYGVASKFGYGSARGDPDVWNGLDHLRFGMDRGYGSSCGFRVWIGALYFDSQPYIYIYISYIWLIYHRMMLQPTL